MRNHITSAWAVISTYNTCLYANLLFLHKQSLCLLCSHQVDHADKSGQSALVHAALRGHSEIIQYLLELEWSSEGQQQDYALKDKVLQQSFIAASSMGHTQVWMTRILLHNQQSAVLLQKSTICLPQDTVFTVWLLNKTCNYNNQTKMLFLLSVFTTFHKEFSREVYIKFEHILFSVMLTSSSKGYLALYIWKQNSGIIDKYGTISYPGVVQAQGLFWFLVSWNGNSWGSVYA